MGGLVVGYSFMPVDRFPVKRLHQQVLHERVIVSIADSNVLDLSGTQKLLFHTSLNVGCDMDFLDFKNLVVGHYEDYLQQGPVDAICSHLFGFL